jgi:hypothetical protein
MEESVDHTKIFKRAWQLTWRHKALWLFGFLFSLFSGRGSANGSQSMRYSFDAGDRFTTVPVLTMVFLALLFGLLLFIVGLVLRYLSRGALIGMVREAEETGQTGVASGWRIGWSRLLALLGIDLVIGIPAVIATLILLGIGLSPLVLLAAQEDALTVLAIILTIVLTLLVIGFLVAMGLVLSVVGEVAHRRCVLEGKGVLDSIRDGYRLGRQNLRQVGLTWVLLFGVSLVFGAVMIPLSAVVLGIAAAPAAAFYAASESILGSVLLGMLFAAPGVLFLAFLGGVYETFCSAVWTLTYLEL